MESLRPRIRKRINQTLELSEHFSFNDFLIKTSNDYQGINIRIEYEYNQDYYCEFQLPKKTTVLTKQEIKNNALGLSGTEKFEEYQEYVIEGEICPGTLSKTEKVERNGKESFIQIINIWLNNLWEDLTDEPLNRAFLRQKEEIQKLKDKMNSVSEEYFTEEEEKSVTERLSQLEEDFKKKIQEEFEDKKEINRKTRELKKEIEYLKMTISSLNKRGWFKSFATKTFSWLLKPENQKLLKSGKDIVQTLLPE